MEARLSSNQQAGFSVVPTLTVTKTTSDLPPELQAFASLLDAQPPDVQGAFQFLLATAMHEAGRFELLNVTEVDGRWHYAFGGAGEVFSVVRPGVRSQTLVLKRRASPPGFVG